jgi:hypothetical protein
VTVLGWVLGAAIGVVLIGAGVRLAVQPVIDELRVIRMTLQIAHDIDPERDQN